MKKSKKALISTALEAANLPAGIGSKLTTPKASGITLKWKRNGDVTPPLLEYWVEEISMRSNFVYAVKLKFNPSKLKKWEIDLAGKMPVFFEGDRGDVVKMQLAAEAMINQLTKEKKAA